MSKIQVLPNYLNHANFTTIEVTDVEMYVKRNRYAAESIKDEFVMSRVFFDIDQKYINGEGFPDEATLERMHEQIDKTFEEATRLAGGDVNQYASATRDGHYAKIRDGVLKEEGKKFSHRSWLPLFTTRATMKHRLKGKMLKFGDFEMEADLSVYAPNGHLCLVGTYKNDKYQRKLVMRKGKLEHTLCGNCLCCSSMSDKELNSLFGHITNTEFAVVDVQIQPKDKRRKLEVEMVDEEIPDYIIEEFFNLEPFKSLLAKKDILRTKVSKQPPIESKNGFYRINFAPGSGPCPVDPLISHNSNESYVTFTPSTKMFMFHCFGKQHIENSIKVKFGQRPDERIEVIKNMNHLLLPSTPLLGNENFDQSSFASIFYQFWGEKVMYDRQKQLYYLYQDGKGWVAARDKFGFHGFYREMMGPLVSKMAETSLPLGNLSKTFKTHRHADDILLLLMPFISKPEIKMDEDPDIICLLDGYWRMYPQPVDGVFLKPTFHKYTPDVMAVRRCPFEWKDGPTPDKTEWVERKVREMYPVEDEMKAVLRICAYILWGSRPEKMILILNGMRNTSKSTIIKAMYGILGEGPLAYAAEGKASVICKNKFGENKNGHNRDWFLFEGYRLWCLDETPKKNLDETFLRMITSPEATLNASAPNAKENIVIKISTVTGLLSNDLPELEDQAFVPRAVIPVQRTVFYKETGILVTVKARPDDPNDDETKEMDSGEADARLEVDKNPKLKKYITQFLPMDGDIQGIFKKDDDVKRAFFHLVLQYSPDYFQNGLNQPASFLARQREFSKDTIQDDIQDWCEKFLVFDNDNRLKKDKDGKVKVTLTELKELMKQTSPHLLSKEPKVVGPKLKSILGPMLLKNGKLGISADHWYMRFQMCAKTALEHLAEISEESSFFAGVDKKTNIWTELLRGVENENETV